MLQSVPAELAIVCQFLSERWLPREQWSISIHIFFSWILQLTHVHSMIEWELPLKKVHPKFFQNPFVGCSWVVWLGIRTWSAIGPYKEKNNLSFFHSSSHSIMLCPFKALCCHYWVWLGIIILFTCSKTSRELRTRYIAISAVSRILA